MLSRQDFSVLYQCYRQAGLSQRELVDATGYSLGAINTTVKGLKERNLLTSEGQITPEGLEALKPHKVDNAVIMAAGLSSRFAPISYEKPKGVLTVRGEVLIERQIRQLQEAGINDITVVVGYKKEQFFYLVDEFGVEIVVNPDYAVRNNHSSIMRVAEKMGNTYLCSSDDYFTENPFEEYVYDAYYAAIYMEGETDEYCLHTKGKEDRIVGVTIGGQDSWVMLGHVYWDKAYSQEFIRILREIYDEPTTADMLWEDIYIEHIESLHMVMRKYEPGVIWEFDSLGELQEFDPDFINNVDSEIIDNICHTLSCKRTDIYGIKPIKQGKTNLSFKFNVGDKAYVYRHPGLEASSFINRASETASEEEAKRLGLDKTFIFEDPESGWKISSFIEDCTALDYGDWAQVEAVMNMLQRLHQEGADTGFRYDVYTATQELLKQLRASERVAFKDFAILHDQIDDLNARVLAHGDRVCLCHNDYSNENFLVHKDGIEVIDWEYSGMSDYASDLAVFICCCKDYRYEDALHVLELYFGRKPSDEELFHCVAYIAIVSFYWFVWALYKEEAGDPVGEWLYLLYKSAKEYGRIASDMADQLGY